MTLMAPTRTIRRRPSRPAKDFRVGTTGWSVADLDDPAIERHFAAGRFEIVDGVLTEMAAAYFHGSYALRQLGRLVEDYLRRDDPNAALVSEVDLILAPRRFVVADALYLNPAQMKAQLARYRRTPNRKNRPFGRIVVAPELLIESMSPGHESHDREIKRRWYEEFGVQNYWFLDAMRKSLECLKFDGKQFVTDCSGSREAVLRPSAYPGLVLPLKKLWL